MILCVEFRDVINTTCNNDTLQIGVKSVGFVGFHPRKAGFATPPQVYRVRAGFATPPQVYRVRAGTPTFSTISLELHGRGYYKDYTLCLALCNKIKLGVVF